MLVSRTLVNTWVLRLSSILRFQQRHEWLMILSFLHYDIVALQFHRLLVDMYGLRVKAQLPPGIGDFFNFFLELINSLNLQMAEVFDVHQAMLA